MFSILKPEPRLDPAIQRKITYLQGFGLSVVFTLFVLTVASFMGFLPRWLAGIAVIAEGLSCWYILKAISTLRKLP